MKKILTVIVFLLLNLPLFSQTKAETKDWILEKYNSFKRIENKNDFMLIENDSLIFHKYFFGYQYYKIAFKDIKSIQIRKNKHQEMEWYQIDLNTNGKIEYGSYENQLYNKDNQKFKNMTILLSPEFANEDYPKRMEKALLRIISLNGGKATVLKEAF